MKGKAGLFKNITWQTTVLSQTKQKGKKTGLLCPISKPVFINCTLTVKLTASPVCCHAPLYT